MEFGQEAANRNFNRCLVNRGKIATNKHSIIKTLEFLDLDIESVLEVGCSTGYVLEAIRQGGTLRAYGLDLSTEAILYGKENFPD